MVEQQGNEKNDSIGGRLGKKMSKAFTMGRDKRGEWSLVDGSRILVSEMW